MDSFAAYGSDSDAGSDVDAGDAPEPAHFRPVWQQAEEEDSEGDSGSGDGERKIQPVQAGDATDATGKRDVCTASAGSSERPDDAKKKRKLTDPFAALSQASASFLTAGAQNNAEPEYFSAARDKEEASCSAQANAQASVSQAPESTPAVSGSSAAGETTLHAAHRSKVPAAGGKKEETTRQKNARKQKLGQANFTVKSNRECPDIWQGSK